MFFLFQTGLFVNIFKILLFLLWVNVRTIHTSTSIFRMNTIVNTIISRTTLSHPIKVLYNLLHGLLASILPYLLINTSIILFYHHSFDFHQLRSVMVGTCVIRTRKHSWIGLLCYHVIVIRIIINLSVLLLFLAKQTSNWSLAWCCLRFFCYRAGYSHIMLVVMMLGFVYNGIRSVHF